MDDSLYVITIRMPKNAQVLISEMSRRRGKSINHMVMEWVRRGLDPDLRESLYDMEQERAKVVEKIMERSRQRGGRPRKGMSHGKELEGTDCYSRSDRGSSDQDI